MNLSITFETSNGVRHSGKIKTHNYMWPQITILVLMAAGLLLNAHYHGKDKEGKHNFWYSFISSGITFSLLYFGGFFDKMF